MWYARAEVAEVHASLRVMQTGLRPAVREAFARVRDALRAVEGGMSKDGTQEAEAEAAAPEAAPETDGREGEGVLG